MLRSVVLTVMLFGLLGWPARSNAAPTGPTLLLSINQARSDAHQKTLRDSYTLRRAATGRADDMARFNYFGHRSSIGRTYRTWLATGPAHFNKTGEIIARNYPTPAALISGWMTSGTHRRILLDPNYTHVGTAVRAMMVGGKVVYLYVAVFGRFGS